MIAGSTPADHKRFSKILFVRITALFILLYSQIGQCEKNFYSNDDRKTVYILEDEISLNKYMVVQGQ